MALSSILSVFGVLAGGAVGYYYGHTWNAAFSAAFLTAVLVVLEVSLSFDNAVVNASVLKTMSPKWQKRFLTWGILIAVFGMRLVFPLAIVSVVAEVSPMAALSLAAYEPARYAQIMLDAHIEVAAFGGAFLLLVGLKYFFDLEKEVHWIHVIESRIAKLGKIDAVEIGLSLVIIYFLSLIVPHKGDSFLAAGVLGVVTYIAVDGLSSWLEVPKGTVEQIERTSVASFLYLEVLDASFSFDGVVGAFALTNNLFIIAIGLGIGALFVRSLTILLVNHQTLNQYLYLEHGAFYAIIALALLMFADTITPIPEIVTGLVGALLIGLSFVGSLRVAEKVRPN